MQQQALNEKLIAASQSQSQTAGVEAREPRWCHRYSFSPDHYDEVFSAPGIVRPHCQRLISALENMSAAELERRWDLAKQLIHENGVTYNVYGDPRGMDRPWDLDPIPLLISATEWKRLEAAMIQRARLLNMLLADLYGPQTVLHEGLLPPELVYAHPGFLRPCHGLKVPENCYIHVYAGDLARGNDGQWWVLGDKTQTPAGAGYALENRIVLSRTLPDVFRDCRVERLAQYFRKMREKLAAIAPRNRENPRIVLLTPGPYNETYFEHAYLARYLGLILVEGGDLIVRDNTVYLKTLGGLQPVDVILRRLDDDYCDPLELRPDSFLGVAGLVQATRAGKVAIANALGSGLIETSALLPYLPALCRRFLQEELRLPSVPTFWCGESRALQHVIANLNKMVIKPTFPGAGEAMIVGERLNAAERAALITRMRARPMNYVGQEQFASSTTPVLTGTRIEPRRTVLRTCLAATDDGYTVMPGGLARVPPVSDGLAFSFQQGGGSKDTWVLSLGPVSTFSMLRASGQPIEFSRSSGDLPSRVADNMYWLGRYVERADVLVRMLRGVLIRLTEKSGLADVPEMPTLFWALKRKGDPYPGTTGEASEIPAASENELLAIIYDTARGDSLCQTIGALYRTARIVRDRISLDTWRILHNLEQGFNERLPVGSGINLSEVLDQLNQMIISLAAFGGLATESMTRGQGWRFLDLGRRLERSLGLAMMLRSTLVTVNPNEPAVLEALLDIADSSMTYRRRYMASLSVAPVLDLLLSDETNPRSLAFQLRALSDHVENLPRDKTLPQRSPEQRLMLATTTRLALADLELLCKSRSDGSRQDLDDLLAYLVDEIPVLSDILTRSYLSHSEATRQLEIIRPE